MRKGVALDADGDIARLAYGPGATITRLNKGLRRRKNRTQLGFRMDPISGYWAKNEDEGDEVSDPTASPRQWIVPSVQDRKNALLLQPFDTELSQATLTTVQHALLRGIEAVFQLEQGEILAEPMPQRDARTGFLLYEATEGGAGVSPGWSPSPLASQRWRARHSASCTSTSRTDFRKSRRRWSMHPEPRVSPLATAA